MRIHRTILSAFVGVALSACGSDYGPTTPPPPAPVVLLKDIVIPNLPSPFYHFEYDATHRISAASYASELRAYNVIYTGDRIAEMQDRVNHNRLEYVYDDAGHVAAVKYHDTNDAVFTVLFFTYDGQKLTGMERDIRVAGGFVIDKTLSFSYYPDGNLMDLTEHRPAIDGLQTEITTVDHFEAYDDGVNVDGFSLIHDDFFDHLVLLPVVQFQKGNPARMIQSGTGVNYSITYTYTYDDTKRPLASSGELTFLNGAQAGQKFQTHSDFTYY